VDGDLVNGQEAAAAAVAVSVVLVAGVALWDRLTPPREARGPRRYRDALITWTIILGVVAGTFGVCALSVLHPSALVLLPVAATSGTWGAVNARRDWNAQAHARAVAARRHRIAMLEDDLGLPRSDWDC
jgi:hypothetical protein